ncbi:HigA protein (Antitoxin to HigB) [Sphingobium herbicidovorans NBRC 16415]|uniref:HigA protein (Antitoxin to HigB) n=1 Tax=Sphingobium herbicidovorans (strain ATCC 700291 / DSM 11019 / CCUG 56400 / KCTC 2939 / LMG 18315 / NBRC 16415 / MH) TaxID=1219045 RepID=A0A086PAA4_SPHHM|nr:HigA family addiction module antitoxin [Sphingobium herbicidovorans]KFG90322.1 HigA protein (Antitoxin to HigB) [Sphingobium herbicidovorans NBRC 16415]
MAETRDFPPQLPGVFLRDRVLRKPGAKITQEALADALDVSRFTVNQIINGHRAITADMAVRLAHVLGTSADLWLDMQKRVDLFEAHRKLAAESPKLTVLREAEAGPPASD